MDFEDPAVNRDERKVIRQQLQIISACTLLEIDTKIMTLVA